MSEIPYYFETPVPKFFRENGLLKNPKNCAFISWCFQKCSVEERSVVDDTASQLITLKPYQFIFGRLKCSDETGLSENEVRTQQNRWEKLGFLKKAPNKTPNRFTIYEWVLTAFSKPLHQQKPRSTTNQPPTRPPHIKEIKEYKNKRNLPPYPPSKKEPIPIREKETDDFPSKTKIANKKIEIYPGVELTQSQLDDCILLKGSLDAVKTSVEFILKSPQRRYKIKNWPEAIANWEIKPYMIPKVKENENMGKRLEELFFNSPGWACQTYHDPLKDQRGLLIFCKAVAGNPESYFVPYVDPEFRNKTSKIIRDKKMQLSRM